VTPEGRLHVGDFKLIGLPEFAAPATISMLESLPPVFVRGAFGAPQCLAQSQLPPDIYEMIRPTQEQLGAAIGWVDMLVLAGTDPSSHGVFFGMGMPDKTGASAKTKRNWLRVAVHLATAFRLRRRLAAVERASPDTADAVLTPGGRIEHAREDAQLADARERLQSAVKQTERARGRLRTREPEQAIDLWKGLVSGRWTLVDHFESDGKRYVLARRNELSVGGLASLTARERQTVAYASLGHTNKLIAYEMGLSASTVGVLLYRAAKKLKTKTREELVAAFAVAAPERRAQA
jgi:DNA-binding CsgD family transcriptional regulator